MPRKAKSTAVTGNGIVRAFNKAVKRITEDKLMTATSVSAGFIIPPGQIEGEQLGYQVFVTLAVFSQKRLKTVPHSGGLFIHGND